MSHVVRGLGFLVMVCSLAACGSGDDMVAPDSGMPDEDVGVGPELPWEGAGSPAALPILTPCPSGWRELSGDVATCAPYPEAGPATCGAGEAHFPGDPICRVLGDACPAGLFAELPPAADTTLFVESGASAGGDGTPGAPYASLSEVPWPSLSAGTVVALSKGTFAGTMPLQPGVSVLGACAAETILTGLAGPALSVVSAERRGEASVVRNVTIVDAIQPGVWVDFGAALDLDGVVVEGTRQVGLFTSGVGTVVTLTDVVVRGTTADFDSRGGRGLGVQVGARVQGERVIIEGNRDVGIFIGGEGSEVILTDSVVRDTRPRELGDIGGRGIGVQDAGRFEATRTLIGHNHELGIFAGRPGSEVVLTDVVIQDTLPQFGADNFGRGASIQDGARLETSRVVIEGSHDVGLAAIRPDTEVVIADTVVRDTLPEVRTSNFGRGINAQDGARIEATRVLAARNHDVGFLVSGEGAEMILTDVTVLDTLPHMMRGDRGYGIHAQIAARLEAHRLHISGSRTLGVASVHSVIDMHDVLVENIEAAICTRSTCGDTPYGYGIATISGSVSVSNFVVTDAATCGVFIEGEVGELDLSTGIVSGAPIGACVQLDGYDLTRLTDGVVYRDNTQNLESTSLPVPDAVDTPRAR